jgi:hypothetical protein
MTGLSSARPSEAPRLSWPTPVEVHVVTPGSRLLALRRIGVDAGSVAAVLVTVLVVCALVSGIVASLPALQRDALRAALHQLPTDELVVEVVSSYDVSASRQRDAEVREALDPLLAVAGGVVVRRTETVAHAEAGAERSWSFAAVTGGPDLVRPAEGRLPADVSGPVVEVAVPAGTLGGGAIGSRMTLVSPFDQSRVRVVLVGSWEPGPESRRAVGPVGPRSLLVTEAAFEALATRASSARWRAAPAIARLEPGHLGDLRATAASTDRAVATAAESLGTSLRVENPLVDVVDARVRELLAQRMLLLVPALMLLLLGAAAALLVAGALAENRREDETLLRSRGADRRQLLGPTTLEAVVLCVLGAGLGPLVAAAVVRIGGVRPELGPGAWGAGVAAALVCWAALVLPTTARAFGGDRGEQQSVERRRRRVLTSLLAVVLLMVALGAVAVVRLESFASTVAATSRWSGGVDPLLVAAPSLLLLALVTVLAVLLLPVLFRLTEWAVRTRGVVLALGTRSISRAPSRAVPLALAVALIAGGVAFATVQRASQQEAREARASYETGSDIRVVTPPPARRADVGHELADLAGLPGVRDVSGVRRELEFVDDVGAELLVADLGGAVGREMVATSADPDSALERLSRSDEPRAQGVPVAVTEDLVEQAALEVGSVFELRVAGVPSTLHVVAVLPSLPTLAEGRAGVLLDSAALQAQLLDAVVTPGEWWLAVDEAYVDEVAAALEDRPDLAGRVLTRDGALRRLAADPGTGGAALADVMAITAVGAALVGGVFLTAVVVLRRRERESQAAALRALGASERDVTLTLATEYSLAAGGGVLAGAVAGVVTAGVALRATALGSGGQPLVPAPEVHVPWAEMLPLLALLLLVPVTALTVLTWLSRFRADGPEVKSGRWR